jgi:hypothetical protein
MLIVLYYLYIQFIFLICLFLLVSSVRLSSFNALRRVYSVSLSPSLPPSLSLSFTLSHSLSLSLSLTLSHKRARARAPAPDGLPFSLRPSRPSALLRAHVYVRLCVHEPE